MSDYEDDEAEDDVDEDPRPSLCEIYNVDNEEDALDEAYDDALKLIEKPLDQPLQLIGAEPVSYQPLLTLCVSDAKDEWHQRNEVLNAISLLIGLPV